MQLIHKSYKTLIAAVLSVFVVGLFFQSCEKKEEVFSLTGYGPSEIARGGEIWFTGTNLNEIVKIELPNGSTFGRDGDNDFLSSTPEEIRLQVPVDYPLGIPPTRIYYTLSDGHRDSTIGKFQIFNTIRVDAIEPNGEGNPLKPGEEITLRGLNLNEVLAVQFKNGEKVEAASFISHADDAITLNLPLSVWSGMVSIEVYGAIDDAGNPTKALLDGQEITVINPVLSEINGNSGVVTVSPLSEVVLSGSYFGVIDPNDTGEINVKFTGSNTMVSGTINVNENKLTFKLPADLKAEQEISVVLMANNANEIASTVKFKVEPTFATGYRNATWAAQGSVTLVGQNLNKELFSTVRFVNPEGGSSSLISAGNRENNENGDLIIKNLLNSIFTGDRNRLELILSSGDTLRYQLDFNKTEMDF